jgi:hypothetical protein
MKNFKKRKDNISISAFNSQNAYPKNEYDGGK